MSASDSIAPGGGSIDDVVARIERMPISWWHVRTRIIIGVATFFDAFDALAIAFVLPVLVPLWKLNGPQIGYLIAAGYLGQLVGALFFGWVAERYGRLPGGGLVDPDLRGDESRLRLRVGLPVAHRRRGPSRVSAWAARSRSPRPISASSPAPRAAAVSSCCTN